MLAKQRSLNIVPRLLRRERAAAYTDVSEPTFDGLVKAGVFPQPRQVGKGIKAWDRDDLDRAIADLPFVRASAQDTTWDD